MLTRRHFLSAAATGLMAGSPAAVRALALAPARPTPTPDQLLWQRDELALFLHFGMNTFTDREWGDGREDPSLFNPTSLDARQWAATARATGFRAMVLTAKHHDGFCLWPTRTTRHSVASSPWRSGSGDLVSEFVDACRREGLRAGLYLSPWDWHEPTYGDSPRYNDFYCDQLTELVTHYGALHEIWFDGANGEGPDGRRQIYDWPRVWGLVRRWQPHAVIFSDAGPDIRWIGNEQGVAGEPNWSTVDPDVVSVPGLSGPSVSGMLQHGDPAGSVWRPGEADVSIRPGWFHHDAESGQVRSAEALTGLYFSSVGRNSKLLLNVPPTRTGRLDDTDVSRLAEFHTRLTALFGTDATRGRSRAWHRIGADTSAVEIDLGKPIRVGIGEVDEDITKGQWISSYSIEGLTSSTEDITGSIGAGWRPLAHGTTVGFRRLDRWSPVEVTRIRVTVTGAPDAARDVRVTFYEGHPQSGLG